VLAPRAPRPARAPSGHRPAPGLRRQDARGDGLRGGLRVRGPALQVALGDRDGDRGHQLQRGFDAPYDDVRQGRKRRSTIRPRCRETAEAVSRAAAGVVTSIIQRAATEVGPSAGLLAASVTRGQKAERRNSARRNVHASVAAREPIVSSTADPVGGCTLRSAKHGESSSWRNHPPRNGRHPGISSAPRAPVAGRPGPADRLTRGTVHIDGRRTDVAVLGRLRSVRTMGRLHEGMDGGRVVEKQ
jgi:hypothetical protein